jgi:hypothetical protein
MKAENENTMRETASEARIIYRADFLVAAGAAAVLAGLLFPLGAHVLDVLLIFSICLAAAIVLITFSARSAVQVQSFPLLIVVVTCLRVALGVACAKLLLVHGRAGTLVNVFGELIVGEHLMLTVLVFCLLATITLGVTFRAAKRISRMAGEFAGDIVPTRKASLETALGADIISESQARGLERRTHLETSFFAGMNGAATFMLCCVVAEFVIIIVAIVGSLAVGASTAGGMALRTQGTLAVGAGAISIISIFTISTAASRLVGKSFMSYAADDWFGEIGQRNAERIAVSANEVASAQTSTGSTRLTSSQAVGAPSANSAGPASSQAVGAVIAVDHRPRIELRIEETQSPGAEGETAVTDMEAYLGMHTREAEWLKEEQTISRHDESEAGGLWVWQEIKDENCYELIAELIENRSRDKGRTVLMAAESADKLPVTVPVNAAVRLSQRNQRCLLIDLDWERDAIAKVFDDGGRDQTIQKGACEIPSCIENLWICPASRLKGRSLPELKDVLTDLKGRYDRLIVYAPNIGSFAQWESIAPDINLATLFADKESDGGDALGSLYRLLSDSGCEVLRPSAVLAHAV